MPPSGGCLLPQPAPASCPPNRVLTPHPQPGCGKTPHLFPFPVLLQSPRLLETPHERALLLLPSAGMADRGPLPPHPQAPPDRRTSPPHYPIKRRPLPLPHSTSGTSPRLGQYPPPLLMARTYKFLKVRSHLRMLDEWDSLHPPPDYNVYPCRLDPHPFMGLHKFIAG